MTKNFCLQFLVYFPTDKEEGLYNLYLHLCPNYEDNKIPIEFSVRKQAFTFLSQVTLSDCVE